MLPSLLTLSLPAHRTTPLVSVIFCSLHTKVSRLHDIKKPKALRPPPAANK